MKSLVRHSGIALFGALAIVAGTGTLYAVEDAGDSLKALQGKWTRRQPTADGPVTFVKEHVGKSTLLTAYDEKGNVLYAHKSEFSTEQTGKVQIFTFFHRAITAGPNAGQVIKEPVSFVYRIANDKFIEVYGLLDGDTGEPNMIVWERMKP